MGDAQCLKLVHVKIRSYCFLQRFVTRLSGLRLLAEKVFWITGTETAEACRVQVTLHASVGLLLAEILFGFCDHDRRQHNETDQVGNCHQAVEGVGYIPNQA